MIFGDPLKFAIHCDVVDEWYDGFWVNGIYTIYINGDILFDEVFVTELKFTLANIEKNILDELKEITLEEKNYCNKIIEGSLKLDPVEYNFDELIKNSLRLSSPDMEDNNCVIYYFFSKFSDYILLSNKGRQCVFKYKKGYVMNILYAILDWKMSVPYFRLNSV